LSPFSATIVQNSSSLRNDRSFATGGCGFSADTLNAWYSGTVPVKSCKTHRFSPAFLFEAAT
jgi:hypothetical protein